MALCYYTHKIFFYLHIKAFTFTDILYINFRQFRNILRMAAGEQRVSLNGSRALSHVYIQHPPLRCNIPETQGLYYDDGNKLILSPTSGQVT